MRNEKDSLALIMLDYNEKGMDFEKEGDFKSVSFCSGVVFSVDYVLGVLMGKGSFDLEELVENAVDPNKEDFLEGVTHGFVLAMDVIKRGF